MICFCLSLVTVVGLILSWSAQRSAYRNGFCDGARYVFHGRTYPSKPDPEWVGFEEADSFEEKTQSALRLARAKAFSDRDES